MDLNPEEIKVLRNHVVKKFKPIIDDYDEIADFIISIINKAKDSSNESLEFIRKEVLELCKVVGENIKLEDIEKFVDDILQTVKEGKVLTNYGDKSNKDSTKIRVYNGDDNDRQTKKREYSGNKYTYQSKRRKDERNNDYQRGGYHNQPYPMGGHPYHTQANIGMQQWPHHHIPNPSDVNPGFIPSNNPPFNMYPQPSDKHKKSQKGYRGSKDPNATTITVVNVPEEFNVIDKLNEHFKKFGQIVNIEIFTEEKKANIKFLTHESATNAIKSPEAVFDNRFIKIFWTPPVTSQEESIPKPKIKSEKPQVAKSTTFVSDEYKKILEEKEKMNEELLEQLQKEIDECIERIKKISDELLNTELSESEKEDLYQRLTEEEENKYKLVSQYKEIKYKNKKPIKPFKPTYPSYGRGRGYGRGYPAPFRGRGGRGGYGRGREETKSLTLDNRPKSLIIKALDETSTDDIKSHFEKFGKVINITSQSGNIIVEMDSRRTAEKAYNQGKELNGKIVDMDWFEGSTQENESHDTYNSTNKDINEKTVQGDIVEVYNPGDENIHDDYDED